MKILQTVNRHIAIWSFLCGDHALKKEVKLISPKLLDDPDFLSPLENKLRFEVFKHKRDWIYQDMTEHVSFGVISFSAKELGNFQTCFSDIKLKAYSEEYKKSFVEVRRFVIERGAYKKPHEKEIDAVSQEFLIKANLEKSYSKNVNVKTITDSSLRNEKNLWLATNRCFIMKKNSEYVIMDGNHRLAAYYWSRMLDKNKILPNKLFGYYWELGKQ